MFVCMYPIHSNTCLYARGILARMPSQCLVYRLGLIPYRTAWRLQETLASQIGVAGHPPTFLLLQHPHVFTFGRRGQIANLLWDEVELTRRQVEVIWVDRGGDVTYHGPGQLVGYPLIPLAPGGFFAESSTAESYLSGTEAAEITSSVSRLPKADTIGYLRRLEEVIILTLARFNVFSFRLAGKTGVFVNLPGSEVNPPAKIASIGVKVDARGVTRHGFALNLDPDMAYWDGIIACGLAEHPAASLAQLLHPFPSQRQVETALVEVFGEVFEFDMQNEESANLLLES